MKGLPEMGLWREDERILRLFVAETWWTRARGLLGRPHLASDQGLWIAPCASVHGLGMSYPIDVVFLDAAQRIRRCARLQPWGMALCRDAAMTIEIAAGACHRLALEPGQHLRRGPL